MWGLSADMPFPTGIFALLAGRIPVPDAGRETLTV